MSSTYDSQRTCVLSSSIVDTESHAFLLERSGYELDRRPDPFTRGG